MDELKDHFISTLSEIANQIQKNSKKINWTQVLEVIQLILHISERDHIIFVYGAGRSGFIGRSFAQRLMHLGLKSCFISDTVTYRYGKDDLLIVISGSGETVSSLAISKKAKEIGGKLALFTNNPESSIGKIADHTIKIEGKSKDKIDSINSLAPYSSLFDISVFSILDSIAGVLMKNLGITENDIDKYHASLE